MRLVHETRIALNRYAALGAMSYELLSQVQKDKLLVMEYLRKKHGDLKMSPNSLHKLAKNLRRECKDYLYVQLGDRPKTKQRIDEVFAPPKRSRKRFEEEFSIR